MKHVICRIEKCLGCRSCELACAVQHSESGTISGALLEPVPPTRRVRVERIDGSGILYRSRTLALQCRHCEEPVCVQACISGGIRRDAKTGEVRIDPEKCVGCWSCVMVCPFGAIVRHEGIGRAMKCDHCAGRPSPACVDACPTRALVYCERDEIQASASRT